LSSWLLPKYLLATCEDLEPTEGIIFLVGDRYLAPRQETDLALDKE
jgi:hypothetical protein